MARYLSVLFIIILTPWWLQGQKEIQVSYDHLLSKIDLVDSIDLVAGEDYQLRVENVNSAYIQDHTTSRSFRYISPIPEVLEPVLPGISGSDVFDHFEIRPSGQREFFLKSLRFFNELEVIRSVSDDLYARTRFQPDPELANEKLHLIQSTFDTTDLQYIAAQAEYFQDYILASEAIYNTNINKVTLMTPDADIVIRERARLSRMAEKIRSIDFAFLLESIARSTVAHDFILSDVFSARKDVVEVRLALYDSYLEDTIYTGYLDFRTQQNWSFDFSTGIFYTNLYEKDYYLASRTEEINDVLQESEFKGDFSVGALAQLSYKFKPDFRMGPALGASISPFDGNIRFLLGLGALVGEKQIIGLSAGISFGQMEVLSGSIERDGFGPHLPENVNRIPTFTKTRAGIFLGITYNFMRTKKR